MYVITYNYINKRNILSIFFFFFCFIYFWISVGGAHDILCKLTGCHVSLANHGHNLTNSTKLQEVTKLKYISLYMKHITTFYVQEISRTNYPCLNTPPQIQTNNWRKHKQIIEEKLEPLSNRIPPCAINRWHWNSIQFPIACKMLI